MKRCLFVLLLFLGFCSNADPKIVYLTDCEGSWKRFVTFIESCPYMKFTSDYSDSKLLKVDLDKDVHFVYGGDVSDRGQGTIRIYHALLDLKAKYPDRVHLILGNRDMNRLNLWPCQDDDLPKMSERIPSLLVRMNAAQAIKHRRQEQSILKGGQISDLAAAELFYQDLWLQGSSFRYLKEAVPSVLIGDTLFLHGAIKASNYGYLPDGSSTLLANTQDWVQNLNQHYTYLIGQLKAAMRKKRGEFDFPRIQEAIEPLRAYYKYPQVTHETPQSVVASRLSLPSGGPHLPEAQVIHHLHKSGVRRVVFGHTPVGDLPHLIKSPQGVDFIFADTSYRKDKQSSVLVFHEEGTQLIGDYRDKDDKKWELSGNLDSMHSYYGMISDSGEYFLMQLNSEKVLLKKSSFEPPRNYSVKYRVVDMSEVEKMKFSYSLNPSDFPQMPCHQRITNDVK